LSLLLLTL